MTQGYSRVDRGWLLQSESDGPCQSCGACCSYSEAWPRFTTDHDDDLARIPPELIDASEGGMRCEGVRCAALTGEVGVLTACSIYAIRPDVCRACVAGDDACQMARARHGLPALTGA